MDNSWLELLESGSFIRVEVSPGKFCIGQIKSDDSYSVLSKPLRAGTVIPFPFIHPILLHQGLLRRTRFDGDYREYSCDCIRLIGTTKSNEVSFNVYAVDDLDKKRLIPIIDRPIKYFHELQTVLFRYALSSNIGLYWCSAEDIFPNSITVQL